VWATIDRDETLRLWSETDARVLAAIRFVGDGASGYAFVPDPDARIAGRCSRPSVSDSRRYCVSCTECGDLGLSLERAGRFEDPNDRPRAHLP